MRSTMERASAVETEVTRDVQFGPFRVLGVPHIELSKPTPTGERFIREAGVDFKLAAICEYLETNRRTLARYSDFM